MSDIVDEKLDELLDEIDSLQFMRSNGKPVEVNSQNVAKLLEDNTMLHSKALKCLDFMQAAKRDSASGQIKIANMAQEKIAGQIKIAALSAQVDILRQIIQVGLRNE